MSSANRTGRISQGLKLIAIETIFLVFQVYFVGTIPIISSATGILATILSTILEIVIVLDAIPKNLVTQRRDEQRAHALSDALLVRLPNAYLLEWRCSKQSSVSIYVPPIGWTAKQAQTLCWKAAPRDSQRPRTTVPASSFFCQCHLVD